MLTQLDEESKRRSLHQSVARAGYEESRHAGDCAERAEARSISSGPNRLASTSTAFSVLLKANNIPFKINPRLVRGLDYYNLTVFEWVTDKLGSHKERWRAAAATIR